MTKKSIAAGRMAMFAMMGCLFACAHGPAQRPNIYSEPDASRPLVADKYSLTADRTAMEEARKDIPPAKKIENDELAVMIQMTTESSRPPQEIRNQFDKAARKKRELIDKDLKKERDDFSKAEKSNRDQFLKLQLKTREDFTKTKHPRDEVTEFYKEQNDKRLEYFANERERRSDFESDVRDKRKNFDDYTREKTSEFNQEHRAYTKRYEDLKKAASAKKNEATVKSPSLNPTLNEIEANQLSKDLEEAYKMPGNSLTPGE
jgi:hypothetical protein